MKTAYQVWLERLLIMELSRLLLDQMPDAGTQRERHILSAAQFTEITSYIGPRFAHIAARVAGFRPQEDGSWRSGRGKGTPVPVEGLHAEDFGLALDLLDVDGILADGVESELAKQPKKVA
ncbi:hypothetical protein BMI86_08015 [Thioclava sp. DLFJ5-1]|uniref:hypothetical protein n=1 Tax=Thioclava sp. DLFJ5-1 TaxID=1915314 RepID=UPI000997BDCE|nr:hypothetical protein [Thioclava sp. DLFJ5-1]OOY20478.1 hypothetical protein BMI86_08015 [Thioclava sp. DLFJ5-1]